MDATPRLRPARPDDVPALEALIARSGLGLSNGFYTDEQAAAITRHVYGVDSQLIADGTYFVIERAGVPVACGGWSKRATLFGGDQAKAGVDPLLDPVTQAGKIRAFFVDPTCARQGLATMLLAHCERMAVAAGFSELEMAATMPGVPFYRQAGYATVEDFVITVGGIEVPLARMRRHLT